jgi:hypothetical protein
MERGNELPNITFHMQKDVHSGVIFLLSRAEKEQKNKEKT